MDKVLSKGEISEMLREGILNVKFIKVDGSERIMRCTLSESITKPHEKKTDREKLVNDNIMSVWDVDSDGWRSFRLDSVLEIYK